MIAVSIIACRFVPNRDAPGSTEPPHCNVQILHCDPTSLTTCIIPLEAERYLSTPTPRFTSQTRKDSPLASRDFPPVPLCSVSRFVPHEKRPTSFRTRTTTCEHQYIAGHSDPPMMRARIRTSITNISSAMTSRHPGLRLPSLARSQT